MLGKDDEEGHAMVTLLHDFMVEWNEDGKMVSK